MSTGSGPVSRAALILAVSVTAAAFAAVLLILGIYFADSTPHPGLYWLALWGFPTGFVLMCLYVGLGPVRRRARQMRQSPDSTDTLSARTASIQ